jgi:predicted Zn-dependent protease
MSIGDTAQALSEWDLSISLVPEDASYRVAYAVLLSAVGRHADARSHAGAAAESAPAYAVARRVLAEALDTLGETRAARDAYREYLARAPQVESKAIALALERIEALAR